MGQKQFKINDDQWSNVSIGRILNMKPMTFYNLFLLWLTYAMFIFIESCLRDVGGNSGGDGAAVLGGH